MSTTQSAPLLGPKDGNSEVLTATICSYPVSGAKLGIPQTASSVLPKLGRLAQAEPPGSELTFRALFLGGIFASINAAVNMYFNFRYAGGLQQYWVIIVSYVIIRAMENLPLPAWLNPKTFGPKEHCIATLCGASAAFSQSLGLTGGLAPLTLFYGKQFTMTQLFIWTVVAAFFGVFLGVLYGELLVLHDRFPWPIAQMNAVTIRSFHATTASTTATPHAEGATSGPGRAGARARGGSEVQLPISHRGSGAFSSIAEVPNEGEEAAAGGSGQDWTVAEGVLAATGQQHGGLDVEVGRGAGSVSSPLPSRFATKHRKAAGMALSPPETAEEKEDRTKAEADRRASLRLFFAFFAVSLPSYCIANVWLQFLVTFPILCWVCSSTVCQVLGEGYTGVGLPGLSLGPSIVLGWNATIIALETTAWMAVGAMFGFWCLSPGLYYSGVTIWPGGLNLFNSQGKPYAPGDGRIELSSYMYMIMMSICFTLIGQVVESSLDLLPAAMRMVRKCCAPASDAAAAAMLREPLNASGSDQGSGGVASGLSTASGSDGVRVDAEGKMVAGYASSSEVEGSVPLTVGFLGVVVLSIAFVIMVEAFDMGMPWWGTAITIVCSIALTYGLGQLMGTAAQNMAMPSSMLLQLLFGYLLPGNGNANIMAAAINNAIVAQTLTLLNDYRTAVLLRVRPWSMFVSQLWGTAVGVVWSVVVYSVVMGWNSSGKITLGTGVWANLGAQGSHLLAQLFGEYGLARIFGDHPQFKWFSLACFIIGILGPIVRRTVPPKYRPYFPDTILIGLGQFAPSNAFSVVSAVLLGLFYQRYLKNHATEWYQKYQMLSTSGMNMGVGIGGLIVFLLSLAGGPWIYDLGGPVQDGCYFPPNMAQN